MKRFYWLPLAAVLFLLAVMVQPASVAAGDCEFWDQVVRNLRRLVTDIDQTPIRQTGIKPELMNPSNIGSLSFTVGSSFLEHVVPNLGFEVPDSMMRELGPAPNGEETYRVTLKKEDFCNGPPPPDGAKVPERVLVGGQLSPGDEGLLEALNKGWPGWWDELDLMKTLVLPGLLVLFLVGLFLFGGMLIFRPRSA